MKIVAVDAFPIRLDRDPAKTIGTAGSPTKLAATEFDYRWSETYPALYSIHFETALVRIETEEGLTGWGEAQAPLAPEVACTIVRTLLRPVLIGQKFKASREDIERLWMTMYSTMRVRGQTGGFMLDAISGVDLALWDLAGKSRGESVARLLRGDDVRQKLPAYLSGLPGEQNKDRVLSAEGYWEQGFRVFKLFHDRTMQQPCTEAMKRAGPDRLSRHKPLQPIPHLVGRFVGEGKSENLSRRNALLEQIRDPVGNNPCFPTARAGQH